MSFEISIDQLPDAISGVLSETSSAAINGLEKACKKTAPPVTRFLKDRSPKRTTVVHGMKPGAYAGSWRNRINRERLSVSATVYNKKYYFLTHLLEDGHVNRNGTRTEGIPHIEPAADLADRTFEEQAVRCIEEAMDE